MASFTDRVSDYQFNPYIQELPTDDVIRVGLIKQQQEDEGIQRIQSSVDQVAGLDIAKPEVKDYVQGKLGQLKQNLTNNISGDLSDHRLTNQLGGYIQNISKDPIIQNGFLSTQLYRKGIRDIEQAKKDGKYSVANEYDFQDKASKWLSDKDVRSSFNSEYQPFIDVDKKLRDVASHLKEDKQITDIPFKTDADGNIIYDPKTHLPVGLDDAIKHFAYSGVSSERILNTFQDALSEDDINQLHINANYHYRGADLNTFAKETTNKYNQRRDFLTESLPILNNQLLKKGISASDKASIQAQISGYTKELGEIPANLSQELSQIQHSDPAELKYNLYTSQYLTGLSKDLSYQDKTLEYKNNPYQEMAIKRQEIGLQYQKMAQENQHWLADYGLKRDEFQLRLSEYQTKYGQGDQRVLPLADNTRDLPTMEGAQQNINNLHSQSGDLDYKYGRIIFPNISDPKIMRASLDKLNQDYRSNPDMDISNNEREYLEQKRQIDNDVAAKQKNLINIGNASKQLYGENLNNLLKGEKGLTFDGGKTQALSPQDILEFNQKKDKYFSQSFVAGEGGETTTQLDEDALRKSFAGTKLAPLANAYIKYYKGQPLTKAEGIFVDTWKNLASKYQGKVVDLFKGKQAYEAQQLGETDPNYQILSSTLNFDNADSKAGIKGAIGNASQLIQEYGNLDNRYKSDYDANAVATIQEKDSKGAQYVLNRNYDGSGELQIVHGDKTEKIPLTAERFSTLFPQQARQNPLKEVENRIFTSINRTTNINQVGDPTNAMYSGYQLSGLQDAPELAKNVRIDVEGAGNFDMHNPQYQLRLYYHYPDGHWDSKVVNNKGFVGLDAIQKGLQGIGSQTIQQLFLSKTR